MIHLSDDHIRETLDAYYPKAAAHLCEQIRAYVELLLRWNARLSLTTITKPDEILRLHFGESLFAVNAVPIRHGRLADFGSGAGFPAIPLGMVNSGLKVELIESNSKKRVFLLEVCRVLGLDNILVWPAGADTDDVPDPSTIFDYVTSRAVRVDREFLQWSFHHLRVGGALVLWVGGRDAEKIVTERGWRWSEAILIPGSEHRLLLRGFA
jgi:16S rRNA (guanine527-N7)-methyltransferase